MKMISGTFKRPDGSPASGSVLTLALSQDAVTIDGSAVIEKYLVWITLDANGAIPSGVQVWGNDEILPANTYYTAEISNPPFGYAYNENLKIIGPSPVNLNTLVPAPVPGVAVAPNTLAAESDVALSNPQNSDVLTYSSGSKKWVNAPAAGGSSTLASDTDVAISSPSDAQVLTFDGASSRWKNKVARAPAGSNICILPWLNNTFQNPLNAGTWAGFTLFTGLEGNRIVNAGSKFKIDLFVSGSGLIVNKAVLQKWNRNYPSSGAFISSTPVTWNGGNASPTLASGSNVSDAIAVTIDPTASYQLLVYFDPSSTNAALYGVNMVNNSDYVIPPQSLSGGDWTGFTAVAFTFGSIGGYRGYFFGLNQFLTA